MWGAGRRESKGRAAKEGGYGVGVQNPHNPPQPSVTLHNAPQPSKTLPKVEKVEMNGLCVSWV